MLTARDLRRSNLVWFTKRLCGRCRTASPVKVPEYSKNRNSVQQIRSAVGTRTRWGRVRGRASLPASLSDRSLSVADGLALLAAATFRGFFVVAVPLDLLGQSLFLTELLESAEHLVDALVGSGLDLDRGHTVSFFDKHIRTRNLAQI